MLQRRLAVLYGRADRGLYFPINHRIVDRRIDVDVTRQADVQSRYRRELRTSFVTGETRQSEAPAWSQRARPTHFLSLRLPARNTLSGRVREMRDAVVFTHQEMEPLFVPIEKLHVTLGVLTLPTSGTAELLQSISSCVEEGCRAECKGPLRLRFRGLGTFGRGRVLFARCTAEESFTTLDALVRRLRRDLGCGLGVDVKGNPNDSYVPHITVAKVRARQQAQFGSRIPAEVWAPHQHADFGDVTFSQVDLCAMAGHGAEGYYKVSASSTLAKA